MMRTIKQLVLLLGPAMLMTSISSCSATQLSGEIAPTPSLSSFYCYTGTMTGPGTDICTVKLSTPVGSNGLTVNLSSNNVAVTLPAAITLPSNTNAMQFTATVSKVVSTQEVTLVAQAGSASKSVALTLSAMLSTLSINASSVNFGNVVVNDAATQSVVLTSTGTEPLTITSVALAGTGFMVSGATFPMTLNPGQQTALAVRFNPVITGTVSGDITVTSNASASGNVVISLSGTGEIPTLSAFYCYTGTMTGPGTDICTVKLNEASASSGINVSLASNNAAVTSPTTITFPPNISSIQFTATVSAVATAQVVTLTANTGESSLDVSLKLSATVATLSVNQTSVAFGTVTVDTPATRSLTLTSTGTEPVTINAATLTGTSFTEPGATFPLTLNPHQTTTLAVGFEPVQVGPASGQVIITSTATTTPTIIISLSGIGSATGSFGYTDSPLINTVVPPNPSTPISSDFFGMAIDNLAPNSLHFTPGMTPFPTFPVSMLRVCCVGWEMMEPSQGQYNWIKMDNSVAIAEQNGVNDVIFAFGDVPLWASSNPTAPCTGGMGAGSCTPPDMTAFDDIATRVVQRYCGKITNYEPWNEPDNPQFWIGNNSQFLSIAQHVYQIVKDPANCGCTNGVCSPNGGANPNRVLSPPISGLNPVNLTWLNSFFASAGTSYPPADLVAFHGYVWRGYQPEQIVAGMALYKKALAKYSFSNGEVWNTETSWELDTNLDQQGQASWLMRYHMTQVALGVSRVVWFSYDNCTWGTLWSSPLCTDTQGPVSKLTDAGNAYVTIEQWLIGANLTHCEQYQNGLWACELQRPGGYDAWVLWSGLGASIAVSIPEGLDLTVYRNWQNGVTTLPSQLTVTQMPVLLETHDL